MWVAAVQINSTPEMNRNLAQARALMQEGRGPGAQLIALPEHFAFLGPEDQNPPSAQPLEGPLVSGFRDLARKLGTFLLLGSFPEITTPEALPFNTSVLLGPGERFSPPTARCTSSTWTSLKAPVTRSPG